MSTPNRVISDPQRLSIRLPLALAAAVLVAVAAGLDSACRPTAGEIGKPGTVVKGNSITPEWLLDHAETSEMNDFDEIESIDFEPDTETLFRRAKHPRSGLVLTGSFVEPPFGKRRTIDDSSLACVKRLPNLKQLGLSYTNVGDAGMEHVRHLGNLIYLALDGTDVSDASVRLLKELSNLKDVFLRDTRVTDEGIAEFERALPELTIHR
jgi:hypothetical protein